MSKWNGVMFSSAHDNWSTPKDTYETLDREFKFNDDPCPLHGSGGLEREWGTRTFVNPPYSEIKHWVAYGYAQAQKGKTVVMLIPSRTDTRWWHDYVMKAKEIRFIKGRLKFGRSKNSAPFPSAVVIFEGSCNHLWVRDQESVNYHCCQKCGDVKKWIASR